MKKKINKILAVWLCVVISVKPKIIEILCKNKKNKGEEFKTKKVKVIVMVIALLIAYGTGLFDGVEKADGAVVGADGKDVNRPLNVVIASVIDTEFRVSWITVENVSGYIVYGNSLDNLNMKAYDDRNKHANGAYEGETHHIRIGDWYNPPTNEPALTPNTTYYFKIVSGSRVYGNSGGVVVIDGEAWNVTTALNPNPDKHHFVHGRVFKQDGATKSRKCVVYCTVLNVTTNTTSAPLSSIVSDPDPPLQPEFGFDFANLRYPNGSIFSYRTGDLLTLFAHGGNEGTGTITTYVLIWKISPFQPRIDVYLHPIPTPEISVEKEFIPSEITTMSRGVVSVINITNIGDADITSMTITDEYIENMKPNDPAELLITITSDDGEVYAVIPKDLDVIRGDSDITISFELPLEVVEVFWEDGKLQFEEETYYLKSIPNGWTVSIVYSLYPVTELEIGTYTADATVTAYSKAGASITETATGTLIVSSPMELVPFP